MFSVTGIPFTQLITLKNGVIIQKYRIQNTRVNNTLKHCRVREWHSRTDHIQRQTEADDRTLKMALKTITSKCVRSRPEPCEELVPRSR